MSAGNVGFIYLAIFSDNPVLYHVSTLKACTKACTKNQVTFSETIKNNSL